ncbi:MAG: glycosyltransferase family 25 protein [Pseudomonadota bacterium]
MRIFVLSLPSSTERRSKASAKLASKGIPFEFIDAVDGRTGQHPYLSNYDEQAFLINRRRRAAPGELGCYVSHVLAWEKCVLANEAVVVLEDDFEITEQFAAGLRFIEPYVDRVSFVRLEPMESRFFVRSVKGEHFSLVKQVKVGMCATGYVITPQGARKFLETATAIRYPIDLFLKYTSVHKQLMHALIPQVVYPTHAESIIGHDARNVREQGFRLGMQRFGAKWRYFAANAFVNLRNIGTKF